MKRLVVLTLTALMLTLFLKDALAQQYVHTDTLTGHTGAARSVVFSPDGGTLASGSYDRTVRLWDAATRQHIATLTGHTAGAYSVAFSPAGSTLASGGADRTVRLWDVATRQHIATLTGHTNTARSVAFSPDGGTLASGGADRTVRLWNVAMRQHIATLTGHTNAVLSVAFSSGGTLASGGADRTVRLWDVATRQHIATLTGHTDNVWSVAFSLDGSTLASGSADGTVRLWDVATRQHIATLTGHTNSVFSVAFSLEGGMLASGSYDRTVQLWDVATRQHIVTLTGHTNWVGSVVFSPDGGTLASGSADGTVRLWQESAQETQTFTVESRQRSSILVGASWYTWERTLEFPDTVVEASYTTNISAEDAPYASVTDITWSGNMVTVSGRIREHLFDPNTLEVTVTAIYIPSQTTPSTQDSITDSAQDSVTDAEGDAGDPVSPPSSTTPPPTTRGLNLTITPSPSGTMLETGDRINLTIKITHNGVAWPEKSVRLYTSGSVTPTLTGDPHQDGGIKGTTDNNGEVQTTLELDKKQTGSFKFAAETSGILPSDPKVTTELSFTVAEGSGAGAGSVNIITPSSSTITVEPNQGTSNGKISLVLAVKTPAGNPLAGARVFLSEVSSSIISTFTDDRPRTDDDGIARTTLQLKRSSATGSITVKVVVKEGVEATLSITVKQTPASLSVSGVPSSITSGNTRTITATVRSKNGTPMERKTVYFSESSSYLRFHSSSRSTNSKGEASTTLYTGGETSGARITVRTDGLSSKSYTIKVVPDIVTDTKYFSDEGKRIGLFTKNYYQTRTKTVKFPGRVTDSTWRSEFYRAAVISDTISGSTVKVKYKILAKTTPLAWIRVWVTAEYEKVASIPGAPSAHPQFQLEMPQLSEVWQELSQVPSETALLSNYPNPFNPETWIPYHLAEPAEVTLTFYDIKGTPVRRLDLGHQMAGIYQSRSRAAYWDGRNERGEWVGSGVYFYQLTAGDFSAMRKMAILK